MWFVRPAKISAGAYVDGAYKYWVKDLVKVPRSDDPTMYEAGPIDYIYIILYITDVTN